MIRAGSIVLTLIVLAIAIPLLGGWILDPSLHPIVVYGTVIEDFGSTLVVRGDDGLDIEVDLSHGEALPYAGEHGVFSFVPGRRGSYSLLTVRDLDPKVREKKGSFVINGVSGKCQLSGNNIVCN